MEADLELLFVCGTPGHMPDDLIEAEWEGGRVFLGNADTIARPLRLGRRRGAGPDRRAARAGRGARAGGARRRRPRPGQARGGHRQRVRGQRPHPGLHRGRTSRPSRWPTARTALAGHRRLHLRYLVRGPRRGDRARRRPDAGGQHRRALVPRGLVPPGRGRSGCSGSTGSSRSTVLDEDGTPPGGRPPARPGRRRLHAQPDRPAGPAAAGARRRLGQRLLPDRAGRVARRAAARWSRCAPPTPPGCAGCCGGWGRRRPSWSRPPSRPRCAPAREEALARLRGPRPDLAAGRVGWSPCGGGC